MVRIVLNQSRRITIPIKQKTADVFDVVFDLPRYFLPNTEKADNQWNSILTSQMEPDFNSKKIDPNPLREREIPWKFPLKVKSMGADSKVVLDFPKSEKMTEQQYEDKIREIKNSMINLIRSIERE